ncbi:MAG: hypothetical protein N3F67_05795 [Acidilobaceae archaeon]|nr:hypothetical protein [Acidilobaceae archaeon]
MDDYYEKLKKHILEEARLLPELLDGLVNLTDEAEDYTCLTLKAMYGRRDKSYGLKGSSNCGAACREGEKA